MIPVFYAPMAADRGGVKFRRACRFVGDVPRDVLPPIPSAGLGVLDPCPAVHADRLQRVLVPFRQAEGSIRVKYLDVAIFLAIAALFGRRERVLSSTFRPSFLSRSYQRPEDGLGGDEAEGLVERQDGAAEWAGG